MLSTLRGSTSTRRRLPKTTWRTTPPKRSARVRASYNAESTSTADTPHDSRKRWAIGPSSSRAVSSSCSVRNRPAVTPAVGDTEPVEHLLEATATEDATGRAGLHEPVREEARDRAGHQRNRRLAQTGAHADTDWRGGAGRHGVMWLWSDHDRRRVPGGRVRQRARFRIVHREEHGGEVSAEVLVDHAPRDLERHPRLEPGLQVCAERVAHERGAGESAAPVAGHVA